MSRGRKGIELDAVIFQSVITEVEAKSQPKNHSQLWAAVAATEWAKNLTPRPLTAQVAMLKAKALGLKIGTPIGKRGEGLGRVAGTKVERKRIPLDLVENLGRGVPAKFAKKVAKAANGSLKSAIALKCLECSNWEMKEVSNCNIKGCSLFPFRPYKKVSVANHD